MCAPLHTKKHFSCRMLRVLQVPVAALLLAHGLPGTGREEEGGKAGGRR